MITRRASLQLFGAGAAASALGAGPALAAETKTLTIGIALPLTGADAESAKRIEDGALLAIDDANAKGGVAGYKFRVMVLDNGTATAGQYDPAQAATNARNMVSNRNVIAAVGPQMSGSGKAMAPILSEGGLAIITPSSTNPDITNPQFAQQYRPAGKAIYFRTVTTDAFQGPYMANYFADNLKVKKVYILDDSGAYGVGIADSFEAQAKKKGMTVLGRDRLDPKAADYTTSLTKIKSLNPDGLYYGGVTQAGVKVAKQGYDIIPKVIKGGGDGVYAPEMLTAAGFPAAEGWYCTIASPHIVGDPKVADWSKRYQAKFSLTPDDYAITAYDAATVILAAIEKVAATGKPVTRAAVRDAIQAGKVQTLQGEVAFDANGDTVNRIISVFQIHHDASAPIGDMNAQFHYVGVAPSV
jgi:branched-chain amino acid transport system substrate-binding protein